MGVFCNVLLLLLLLSMGNQKVLSRETCIDLIIGGLGLIIQYIVAICVIKKTLFLYKTQPPEYMQNHHPKEVFPISAYSWLLFCQCRTTNITKFYLLYFVIHRNLRDGIVSPEYIASVSAHYAD